MITESDIQKAAEYTDRWLVRMQQKHIKMIEKSILKLEKSIVDMVSKLSTDSEGNLEGLKVNLKAAQEIHKKIEVLFGDQFSRETRAIINDFSSVTEVISKSYAYLDKAVKFTSIDTKTMEIIGSGYWSQYIDLGNTSKNKIVQSMYDMVIGGQKFSDLVGTVQSTLTGSGLKTATGRSMAQYSRLYAKDMVMNFHNEVNLKKAADSGLKHFLYVGDIIKTTRPFCAKRAGSYYTKNQIDSWTYKWAGKKGPAFIDRGGYNCRHHWQPIDPKWLGGKKKVNVANWKLEQKEKEKDNANSKPKK